jgi:hypothetical protein
MDRLISYKIKQFNTKKNKIKNPKSKTVSLVKTPISGPCEQHKQLLSDRKLLSDKINQKNAECEDLIFGPIQKYFKKEEDKTTCKMVTDGSLCRFHSK